jgi:NAD-dependent DNA ligase
VQVSGAKVSNVTVNNLKWAMDRGLGIGAKVKIVRSGEIIPKIVEVVKAVPLVVPPEYKWHWDENGTHAMIDQKHHGQDAITVEKFKHFFGTLEIDHASEALAKALVAAGVQSTVDLTAIDPYEASGYSKAILAKVIPQVEKLQKEGAPLPKLAKASGVFPNGVGERRIQKLLDNDLDVKHLAWNWDKQSNHAKAAYTQSICVVLGPNVGMQVVDNLQAFGVWLGASMIPVKAPSKKAKKAGSKLAGIGVTFTGFRDKVFENVILDNGGDVVDFGSKTTVLIISLSGKASGKIDKAKERGIPVLTLAQFKEKHGI